ncbi:hypothetical protein CLF_107876 [Clonorchis sinensis]|uniref:Uncharacterized protein n=1 Tax=Clonorchis sinensis TaxID=79923 RepID=G7YR34_CLOSI|nr:hypothetical protein CLF_107876 [Clonorchis sinensis]
MHCRSLDYLAQRFTITRMDFRILFGAYVAALLDHTNKAVHSGHKKDVTLIEHVRSDNMYEEKTSCGGRAHSVALHQGERYPLNDEEKTDLRKLGKAKILCITPPNLEIVQENTNVCKIGTWTIRDSAPVPQKLWSSMDAIKIQPNLMAASADCRLVAWLKNDFSIPY